MIAVYGDDRSDPDEIECILNFGSEAAECKLSHPVFGSLGNVCNISDGLAVEIFEFFHVEKRSCMGKISDCLNDSRKCLIDIGFVEFSVKGKYFDAGTG